MPDEAQNKPLEKEKFAKFLRGAKEKVLTVPGSESRRCNEIWGWQYPPVGKMDIAERLEQTANILKLITLKMIQSLLLDWKSVEALLNIGLRIR